MSTAIRIIRPKVLFKLLEDAHPDENVTFDVLIPTSMIGGLTLLESSILVTLMRLLQPADIFEFGTYHGATSVLLASNSPEAARVTTLDLPPDALPAGGAPDPAGQRHLQDGAANDAYLRRSFAARGALYLDRAGEAVQRKVRRLQGDSRALDPQRSGLAGGFDFIFIDGGHDFDTVRIDTANALTMARGDSVILWHDYRSTLHGDVTRFVDDFSREAAVIHVENTMLAFTLLGRHRSLLPAS
jgi:predicted O-methyltransferase YrrM